jgi:hypothetical protein
MTRFAVATTAAVLLGCGSAYAQVGGMSISPGPSLGMTSPLGVGPGSPVAPARIPMGATELASPGVSPMISGTSPMAPSTSSGTTCGGIGGSLPQASFGVGASSAGASSGMGSSTTGGSGTATALFDGGGMAGSASGACAASASGSLAGPAAMASSPTGIGSVSSVGRVGIPMGSTELGVGGLSPLPSLLTPNPSVPLMTLTPLVVAPNLSAPVSTLGSTPTTGTSPLVGTGTPSVDGRPTSFGLPLPTRPF